MNSISPSLWSPNTGARRGSDPFITFARFSQEPEQCVGTTAPSRRCAERPMRRRAQAAFDSPLPLKARRQFQAGVTDAKRDEFLLKEKQTFASGLNSQGKVSDWLSLNQVSFDGGGK